MCRWLAYSGPPIYLEDLLVKPSHSLLVQSLHSRENPALRVEGQPDLPQPVNGDGFGIGWYDEREEPGVFRDLRPAWSDDNLLNLAAHIKSGLFLAHLRAAVHGAVQRSNNHPFRWRNWLFQHNGVIPGFDRIKRDLRFRVREDLYPLIRGTTDSETAFYLAITLGLADRPRAAMEAMVAEVELNRQKAGIAEPVTFTCALSDGDSVYALRYSSDRNSRTLYVNEGRSGVQEVLGDDTPLRPAHIVLSEPLDDCSGCWVPIPESSFVTVRRGHLEVEGFEP